MSAATPKSDAAADEVTATDTMAAQAAGILSIARAMSDDVTADRLFSRLEAFDKVVAKVPIDPDKTFVALGLPTANDLIHLTTTRRKLEAARQWVRDCWSGRPPVDESITLASLTLIYVVNEGLKRRRDKREIWQRIKRRLDSVSPR